MAFLSPERECEKLRQSRRHVIPDTLTTYVMTKAHKEIREPWEKCLFREFDQQGFAEAKAYKKPGKIYYFSTFRGHRDSIIKRLVK